MATRTLTIRGLPDATLARLRAQASAHRRSINGEVLALLDAIPAKAPESAPPVVVRESAPAPYTTDRNAAESIGSDTRASGLSERVPVIETVDQLALAAVCERHHIRWMAVFGSFARGDARPDSDVDVVVEFATGRTPGFGLLRVAEALRPLFGGRRIDLLTRRGLSARLREPVLNSATTIYVAP